MPKRLLVLNETPPLVGEIRKGREIGYSQLGHKYVWHACEICGRERWQRLLQQLLRQEIQIKELQERVTQLEAELVLLRSQAAGERV